MDENDFNETKTLDAEEAERQASRLMSSIVQASQDEKEKALTNIKASMGEKIEATKTSIIDKLRYLKKINDKLKKNFVPSVVINNLNQSIKDVEIETNKMLEQNKFLRNQELQSEKDLKDLLKSYDKTEFAEDNVEYLLRCIKNFDVLLASGKTVTENEEKPSDTQIDSKLKDDFNHLYDDYFS